MVNMWGVKLESVDEDMVRNIKPARVMEPENEDMVDIILVEAYREGND